MTRGMPRRRGWGLPLAIVGVVILLLVLAWLGYFYASTRMAGSALDRTTANLAAEGIRLDCAQDNLGQFPLGVAFLCGKTSFADAGGTVSGALGPLTAKAPLYWPGSIEADLAGPLDLAAPGMGLSLQASWAHGATSLAGGLAGLKSIATRLDGLVVADGGGDPGLPFDKLAARSAEIALAPGDGDSYQLTVKANDVAIARSADKTYPTFDTELALTAEGVGQSLGKDAAKTIRAWLTSGGTLQIDRLAVSSGDSAAIATGTLRLSADGLLSGDLTLHLVGLDDFPDIAGQIRQGLRRKTAQVVTAIETFAKPVKEGGKRASEIPVTIADGVVTVGGMLQIATIPPLRF